MAVNFIPIERKTPYLLPPSVKDYGRLLSEDPEYADRAQALSAVTQDAAEYITSLQSHFAKRDDIDRIAWHPPCTLQHGMQLTGVVERLHLILKQCLLKLENDFLIGLQSFQWPGLRFTDLI